MRLSSHFDPNRSIDHLIKTRARRRALIDLSPMTHCSVIGTCLTTAELRKILKKILGDHVQKYSDYEVHKQGVGLASVEGLSSKLLNKALDEKHARVIRRFDKAKAEGEVEDLWTQAKRIGEIEGPYWAVITHPSASETLFTRVFGDVHMLSHLVGSSNRADIQRLVHLDSEVSALLTTLESTRAKMGAGFSQRDLEIQRLQLTLTTAVAAETEPKGNLCEEEVVLRHLVTQLQQKLASEINRRERIQLDRDKLRAQSMEGRHELQLAQERNRILEDDLHTLEGYVAEISRNETRASNLLDAKIILYVGGKTATIPNLRDLVERLGGSFLHHDGGTEQKTTLLPGLIGRADCVFFPVDFVSHQAMQAIKRYCGLAQIPFMALQRSGIAGFSRGLREYMTP